MDPIEVLTGRVGALESQFGTVAQTANQAQSASDSALVRIGALETKFVEFESRAEGTGQTTQDTGAPAPLNQSAGVASFLEQAEQHLANATDPSYSELRQTRLALAFVIDYLQSCAHPTADAPAPPATTAPQT